MSVSRPRPCSEPIWLVSKNSRLRSRMESTCGKPCVTGIRPGDRRRSQLLLPRHPPRFDLYVKEVPPARGNVEAVIFLFETPADPAQYPWQATWYAEHQEESTLCFYATHFVEQMVGPGIGQSRYGGALFLFPPRPIRDIWTDPSLVFARTFRGEAHCCRGPPFEGVCDRARVASSSLGALAPDRQTTWKTSCHNPPYPFFRASARPAETFSRIERS